MNEACIANGQVCAGRGECRFGKSILNEADVPHYRCECYQELFDSLQNCAFNVLLKYQMEHLVAASVFLLLCITLATLYSIEFTLDYKRDGNNALKQRLVLCKLFGLLLNITHGILQIWFLINATRPREITAIGIRVAFFPLVEGLFLVFFTLQVVSWSEIIEKHRTMAKMKGFAKLRTALYIVLALVVAVTLILDVLNIIIVSNFESDRTVFLFASFIFGLFTTLIFVFSLFALIRSYSWWSVRLENEINSFIRYKTFSFMTVSIIALIVAISLFWRAVRLFVGNPLTPVLFFWKSRAVDTSFFLFNATSFIFLQRNICSSMGGFCVGASNRAHKECSIEMERFRVAAENGEALSNSHAYATPQPQVREGTSSLTESEPPPVELWKKSISSEKTVDFMVGKLKDAAIQPSNGATQSCPGRLTHSASDASYSPSHL